MKIFKKIKNMCGSATVEAVVGFTAFLFTVFTIMNVVNYCRAQMLVSNALDTAAKELAQYSYFYKMSGLNKLTDSANNANKVSADELNGVIGTVDTLYQSVNTMAKDGKETIKNTGESVQEKKLADFKKSVTDGISTVKKDAKSVKTSMEGVQDAFDDVADNPIYYLKCIAMLAGSDALEGVKSNLIAAPLARSLFIKNFGKNAKEADEALKKLGIVNGLNGMDFSTSRIFYTLGGDDDESQDIHLIVYYNVKLTTFFKDLDFSATFCKESRARAWLAGDNVDFCGTAEPSKELEEATDPNKKDGGNPDENNSESEETKEEQVDTTGSYWNKNNSEDQFEELYKSTHSNLNYAGLNAVYGELGTEHLVAANQTTAYGFTAVKEWQTLHIMNSRLTQIESLNNSKEIGQKSLQSGMSYSDGTPLAGISPTVQEYHLTVYVPENMDEGAPEERAEMVRVLGEMADKYNDAGYSFTYEIVPAGGNYDYSND